MADLLIAHGYVVTMNPRRDILRDGAVAITGNQIVAVGPSPEVLAAQRAPRVIDARGRLVLPGFIDGHNHTFHFLTKGIVDVGKATLRLYQVVFPSEAAMTPDDVYIGSLANFVEMIRSGTTCFNDPDGFHSGEIARAMQAIGIRGIISRSTWDAFAPEMTIPEHVRETTEQALERGEDLVRTWQGRDGDRIRAWFSLRSLHNASDRLAQGVKERADRYGVGIHCHESSDGIANDLMVQRWGKRGIERFRDLGLLGPNLYLAHMGWVTEDEVALLRAHDVKVCHNPSASMFGSMGNVQTRMFPRMMAAGLTIALGTDAGAISRFLDMVRVMYCCVAGHREWGADREAVDASKALEMATIDGARALLWDDAIGSLEPGKRADLIVIATDDIEWHPNPLGNPLANLVYSADGHSVETVIIDGRVIMEGRRIVTVDEGEVLRHADAASERLLDRIGVRLTPKWPVV